LIVAATLTVTRELRFGVELRRGRFEVLVDNNAVGTVENHGTIETMLEPGRHTIEVRHGRYSSRRVSFEVTDGDVLHFRCHGVGIWPLYVASVVVPNLAITLKRE
jgi:hypothetical protein